MSSKKMSPPPHEKKSPPKQLPSPLFCKKKKTSGDFFSFLENSIYQKKIIIKKNWLEHRPASPTFFANTYRLLYKNMQNI